jgi:hypothetical protein
MSCFANLLLTLQKNPRIISTLLFAHGVFFNAPQLNTWTIWVDFLISFLLKSQFLDNPCLNVDASNVTSCSRNYTISNQFCLKLQLLVESIFSIEMLNNYNPGNDQFDTWPLFSVLHMVKDIVNLQLLHCEKLNNNVDISSSILLESAFNLGNFLLTHTKTAICLENGLMTGERKNYEITFASQYLLEALYFKFLLNCFKIEHCHRFVDVWQNVLMVRII